MKLDDDCEFEPQRFTHFQGCISADETIQKEKVIKMNDTPPLIGIGFFSAVMASISHELKNRIAIMKEHAGLMRDYSDLAVQGREINTERLGRLGTALSKQVVMADEIIKNMNKMSHSVDDIFRTFDINEILRLSTALAEHTANRHRVNLQFRPSESRITVTTVTFFLMNLIWLCLTALFQIGDKARTVAISAEKRQGDKILIRMQMNGSDLEPEATYAAPSGLDLLAGALNADVEWKSLDSELLIYLPIDLSNSARSDELTAMITNSCMSE